MRWALAAAVTASLVGIAVIATAPARRFSRLSPDLYEERRREAAAHAYRHQWA